MVKSSLLADFDTQSPASAEPATEKRHCNVLIMMAKFWGVGGYKTTTHPTLSYCAVLEEQKQLLASSQLLPPRKSNWLCAALHLETHRHYRVLYCDYSFTSSQRRFFTQHSIFRTAEGLVLASVFCGGVFVWFVGVFFKNFDRYLNASWTNGMAAVAKQIVSVNDEQYCLVTLKPGK